MNYNPICAKCPFKNTERLCSTGSKFIKDCPTKYFENDREEIKQEYFTPK